MSQIYPVVLCGGSGTRLWPSSRKAFPKQFSPLVGEESLYQQTLRRLSGGSFAAPLIMTTEDFRFICRDQADAAGINDTRVILEPVGRNTAPAVLTAALSLAEDGDALMLVAPSDHLINQPDRFLAAVAAGEKAARSGKLVTFGVTPDRPETGFGYLELAASPDNGGAEPLKRFVEKPDAERAVEMLATGRYLWNAGIFLFRVADIIAAFRAHAPEMVAPCEAALAQGEMDLGFLRLAKEPYGAVRAESIDYAVMEKADDISVVPLDAGWSDLGSWSSFHDARVKEPGETLCEGPVTALDCENTVLRSEDKGMRLVGLGLKNIVAVATRDAVLVADMDKSQQVKDVVETLRADNVAQADDHMRFHRPWGWYESLCISDNFQVKRIMVKPGGVLSLQSHKHRAEHWVVVAGEALVTVDKDVRTLKANESVYIPLGAVHRMENRGQEPMYLIEVQTGSYLGEDDIIRYEDIYNRG